MGLRTYLLIRSIRAFALRNQDDNCDPYWRKIWARNIRRMRRLGEAKWWREQHIRNGEELGFTALYTERQASHA